MSIIVKHVSKRYWLKGAAPQTFQQTLSQTFRAVRQGTPFWALSDVSFQVAPGESVGLIGPNGAGKSTLLRLICGLGRPTSGHTSVEGRVAALLELGVGFHPQLTGRENVYISGVVSGLRHAEVTKRFDDIVSFAEIERFIDQPLRTYSSGMQVRLAFAVAMHVDPQVLIIDEALAVGDARFQQKCVERIEHFQRAGKTLLLVSHDTSMIERFCDRAIWMQEGKLKADDLAGDVVEAYRQSFGGYTPHESEVRHAAVPL
jgi:lipopolysaccharide transport system ATP-binding protein